MRATEFIIEASGLRAARPGEVYKDPAGIEYQFQNWNWEFPSDPNLTQYQSVEDMQAEILQQTANDKNKIVWINRPAARSKSFAFAKFAEGDVDKVDRKEIWIGKFFDRKNPNNTITDSEVKGVSQLTAAGSGQGTSSAIKAQSALQPGNIGLADNRARNIQSIRSIVSKHQHGVMLTSAMDLTLNGADIVFQDGANISSALQDDFCEVLAPIGIITKHPLVQGTYQQALIDAFGTADISNALVKFPPDQNNPLIDSYIVVGEQELGVSHKGKQGAKATITNIWQAKKEALKTPNGPALAAKYKKTIDILDICYKESGIEQPITLGIKFGLINSMEATVLRKMMVNPRDPSYQLLGDPKNPNAVVKSANKEDLAKVPQELMRLFLLGGYKSGSYVSFLCLARVAKLVADHINKSSKLKFGDSVKDFLNSSAMVQAKSIVSKKGKDAAVKSIYIVYPPNFKGKAKIESNGYSGTQVKGKFSFSLPST